MFVRDVHTFLLWSVDVVECLLECRTCPHPADSLTPGALKLKLQDQPAKCGLR